MAHRRKGRTRKVPRSGRTRATRGRDCRAKGAGGRGNASPECGDTRLRNHIDVGPASCSNQRTARRTLAANWKARPTRQWAHKAGHDLDTRWFGEAVSFFLTLGWHTTAETLCTQRELARVFPGPDPRIWLQHFGTPRASPAPSTQRDPPRPLSRSSVCQDGAVLAAKRY